MAEDGNGGPTAIDLFTRMLAAQERTASGVERLNEEMTEVKAELTEVKTELTEVKTEVRTLGAKVDAGFKDTHARIDIVATWRGGEVIKLKERMDRVERELDELKKAKG